MFRGNSSAAKIVGRYVVVVQDAKAPSDDEWDKLISFQLAAAQAGVLRVLVFTDGGAPNAAQRARLNERAKGLRMIIAVLTPSALARAAGTAIRWFNPDFRAFDVTELDRALDHLAVSVADRALVLDTVQALRSELHAQQARRTTSP